MGQLHDFKENNTNEIDLCIALFPEMVRVVRLTVSGIASTVGLHMDVIEDIKVAVSEICNRLITQNISPSQRCIIKFVISGTDLKVIFKFEDYKPKDFKLFDEEDSFGLAIVNSLMDDVIVENASDSLDIISLIVHLEESLV